jgi:hypothetical protein
MADSRIFCNTYYEQREKAIHDLFGERLDSLRENIGQLYSSCEVRLAKYRPRKLVTTEDLLAMEPRERQDLLAAIMYNSAFWFFEASYLMLCLGQLNIAYSNLRSCLERSVAAHIVENIEDEACSFLQGDGINLQTLESIVTREMSQRVLGLQKILNDWGVHTRVSEVLLYSLFGPVTFEKMLSVLKPSSFQAMNKEFMESVNACIEIMGEVFVTIYFLMKTGVLQN